jgi:PhzF family phenazine biosynthesis protein
VTHCTIALSESELQAAARLRGGPTCAFVSGAAPVAVRFFTPVAELQFCVHGALAAGTSVAASGNSQEAQLSIRGRSYKVQRSDGGATIALPGPFEVRPEPDPGPVIDALGLKLSDLDERSSVLVASAGSPKWLVPVADWQRLIAITPQLTELAALSRARGVNGAYVFTMVGVPGGADVAARGFNPAAGVNEDAATGVAAAALAWAWRDRSPGAWLLIDQYVGSVHSGRIRVCAGAEGVQVGGEVRTIGKEKTE